MIPSLAGEKLRSRSAAWDRETNVKIRPLWAELSHCAPWSGSPPIQNHHGASIKRSFPGATGASYQRAIDVPKRRSRSPGATEATCNAFILKTIKASYPTLPVIAMSCNNNINNVAYASGFDGYIEKPFDFELLYRILRKHIAKPFVHCAPTT